MVSQPLPLYKYSGCCAMLSDHGCMQAPSYAHREVSAALFAVRAGCAMTEFVTTDSPFASVVKAVVGKEQHLERYWPLSDLQAALDASYSDLGEVREKPESPDRLVTESVIESRIHRLGAEMRRRIRGGQDLEAARHDARRYPPELIRHLKEAIDLRDVIARDTGIAIPANGKIRSPLRSDDHTPSFKVGPKHFYDFGTHEHGDLIDWRMRWHHVPWWQAVESYAVEAGISFSQPSRHRASNRSLHVREVSDGRV